MILVPFFFVNMGMNFEFSLIFTNFFLVFVVLVIGFSRKMIGTLLAKPFVNFNWEQLYVMGWTMNGRGAIEIALALIAFNQGLLSREIYSSLIILALVTTIIFLSLNLPTKKHLY